MSLLCSYCKKKAQKILRNMTEPDNGFSAWMALSEAMMSSTPQQLGSLLRALMKFNFSGSDCKSRVLEWEIEVSLYDRLSEPGEELPDKIKVTILVENAPMKLRDHLQVNADRFQRYADVRSVIMSYLSTRKFSTQSTDRQDDPMQVDAFKGLPYHKGKGKGGKNKGKGDSDMDTSWQAGTKGKASAKGKGRGMKGKGKSEPFQGYCGFCGAWGHKSSGCRKNPYNQTSGKPGVSSVENPDKTATAVKAL